MQVELLLLLRSGANDHLLRSLLIVKIIEGFTKVFYPEASNTVIFVIMAVVLLVRPSGLFGRTEVRRV